MLTIKRITVVLMLLLALGISAPRAFADPGETQTPPGETSSPPGDGHTPGMAQGAGGLTAWVVVQMLRSGWGVW
ncbi:MAG TPA: hypothetical protein VN937_19110 [Blastocatellia bacterium]|nr:hypothetical protein [Blastocatellia bacterium]